MLLLLFDSLLLIFITFCLGDISVRLLSNWLKLPLKVVFYEKFLLGLAFSATYFNLVSLVLPVNWVCLVPLLITAIIWQGKHKTLNFKQITHFRERYLTNRGITAIFCLLMLMFVYYTLIPPYNYDSPDYHYLSIHWYEHHKVIPGLGNVHGRYAFNPATFILSAPYSFSSLIGQAIYPLNPVLVVLFYTWLFKNILERRDNWSSIVYIITAILLFRPILANIPSPASEPLVTISVATVFFRLIDIIRNKQYKEPGYLVASVCISVFAVTAKLTSLPILLVSALTIFLFAKRQRLLFYFQLLLIAFVILAPWITRNVVLSGYMFYPLYQLDLFNVDWKVPKDIAFIDYALGTFASKGEIDKDGALVRTTFAWFLPWIKNHFQAPKAIDFFILILCFSSPFIWMLRKKTNTTTNKTILLWLCAFIGAAVWLFKAPEYRFGLSFLLMSFAIPALYAAEARKLTAKQFNIVGLLFFIPLFAYYSIRPTLQHPRLHTNGISKLWLMPMRDESYYLPTDISTFKYQDLGNGTKVYMYDKAHHCLQVEGKPCMVWYYGKIRLRGTAVEQGFRNVTIETRESMPFIYYDKDQPR